MDSSTATVSDDAGVVSEGDASSSADASVLSCTPQFTGEILTLSTSSFGVAFSLTNDWVAASFFDPTKSASLRVFSLSDGRSSTSKLSNPVRIDAYRLETALAWNGQRFGVAWTEGRQPEGYPPDSNSWGTVLFSTLDPASARSSRAYLANEDLDRTGGGNSPVQAKDPTVMSLGDLFFVAWDDTRTKEPRTTGVNLAYWSGVYGIAFSGAGEPALGQDVQVAQPSGMPQVPQEIAGVAVDRGILIGWLRNRDSEHVLHTRLGAATGRFSPAEPTEPVYRFGDARARAFTMAKGPDGRVLAVLATSDDQLAPARIQLQLLTSDGRASGGPTTLQTLPAGAGIGGLALESTATGYWLAYDVVMDAPRLRDRVITSIRAFRLGAGGEKMFETAVDVPLTEQTSVGALRLRPDTPNPTILFATRPARSSDDSATTHDVALRMVRLCGS